MFGGVFRRQAAPGRRGGGVRSPGCAPTMACRVGGYGAAGRVRFGSQALLSANAATLNGVRGSRLAMIFQDPMTALTPHLTIGVQLAEVLVAHRGNSWVEAQAAALRMLERVAVPEPKLR